MKVPSRPPYLPMPKPGKQDPSGSGPQLDEATLLVRIFRWLEVDGLIDVGAYRGDFVQFARANASFTGPILALDPDPVACRIVRDRMSADPNLEVLQVAVDREEGSRSLQLFDRPNFNSLHQPNSNLSNWFDICHTGSREVRAVRLDHLLAGGRLTGRDRLFIKLDTQGNDLAALQSLGHAIARVVCIHLELSVLPIYRGVPTWTKVIETIEGLGFSVVGMSPVTRDPGHLRVIEFDATFVREA